MYVTNFKIVTSNLFISAASSYEDKISFPSSSKFLPVNSKSLERANNLYQNSILQQNQFFLSPKESNLTIYISRLTLNTESDTLRLVRRSAGNSHTNHSNMTKGTFPESWTPSPENSMYLGSI